MRSLRSLKWNTIFDRYRPVAVRFAEGLIHDRGRAEDLFQEAARAVYERWTAGAVAFDSETHLRNYLFRALRNLAVEVLRDPGRGRTAALEDAESASDPEPAPHEAVIRSEDEARRHDHARAVEAAIARLKPDEGLALRLRYAEGLTYREMARRTGVSISTLQGRVEAGLAKIRRKVGKGREVP